MLIQILILMHQNVKKSYVLNNLQLPKQVNLKIQNSNKIALSKHAW